MSLTLSRKEGETIVINGNIFVTVKRVDGRQVKISIETPEGMPINRKEIQDRIDAGVEQK